jgi:predicted DNA-binding protein YlxM (UPF0122 family)
MIRYYDLKKELKKTGLSYKEIAEILGITYQALYAKIKRGKPEIHLITYALSLYFSDDYNKISKERDLWNINIHTTNVKQQ